MGLSRVEAIIASSAIRSGDVENLGRMQVNCDMHGPYMAEMKRYGKRVVLPTWCPFCSGEPERLEREKKLWREEVSRRDEMKRCLERAAIPLRFTGKTLSAFKAESDDQRRALRVAHEFVDNWSNTSEKGRWLVFSGLPGTGKSHLAVAILQALMPANVGRYLTCMELIQRIRATWRKDSDQSETEILEKLAAFPLLVIDEVGVQYGTDSEQNHLFDVLDRRYREMMPTILLTNQDKDGFRQFVGDRVYDRMTECAKWVPFTWGSYRPQARREMEDA